MIQTRTFAVLMVLGWAAATQAFAATSKVPARFPVAADSAKQSCYAQRLYGDPLVSSDEERVYDLYCGGGGDPVGRVYLLHNSAKLEAWRKRVGVCADPKILAWRDPGLDQAAAVLCKGGQTAPGPGEPAPPAEERLSAIRNGWLAAGNALPPAAPGLEDTLRILLGVSKPGSVIGPTASSGSLLSSLSTELGGSVAGASPEDFQTLVAAGRESNTLSMYVQAENYFSQAIAAHRTFWPNDRIGDADLKLELALNLSNQRRFFESRKTLAEARVEAAGDADELAKVDLYQAEDILNDERNAGRVASAASHLRAARAELATASRSNPSMSGLEKQHALDAMVWRISARVAGRDAAEARKDLQNASASLDLIEEDNAGWLRALVEGDRASLELAQNRPQDAVKILRAAVDRLEQTTPGTRIDGELTIDLGRTLAAAGNVSEALAAYRKGFDILGHQGETSGATADQAVSYVRLLTANDSGKPLGKGDPRAPEIFAAFETVSSTSVHQTAAAAAARLSSGEDAELIRKWQDAQRASVSATVDMNRLNALQTATPEERAEAVKAFKTARAADDALARTVYEHQPGYATLAKGPLSLAELQGALGADDIVVRLLVGARGGAGLLVTKEAATPFLFTADASEISRLVGIIKTSAREASSFDLKASNQLYEALFGGVRAQMLAQPQKRMILDVQGALASLPFAILITSPSDKAFAFEKADWLGQRYDIVVTAGLRALRTPTDGFKTFVGYGDFTPLAADASKKKQIEWVIAARGLKFETCSGPMLTAVSGFPPLDETKAELEAVQKNLGGEIHLGEDFHPANVMGDTAFSKADLIVLATHGVFSQTGDSDETSDCMPDAALLTSAPTESGDMFLDNAAVLKMKLSAKLAILSACDTGTPITVSPGQTGLPSGGDALSGFARSFIYAGAQNVIVTHWPVNDTYAPTFMNTFTLALKDGKSPEAALRFAQGESLKNPENADPFFWGPFTLVSMGLRTQ